MTKKHAMSTVLHGFGRQDLQLSQDDFQMPQNRATKTRADTGISRGLALCAPPSSLAAPQSCNTPTLGIGARPKQRSPCAALGAPPNISNQPIPLRGPSARTRPTAALGAPPVRKQPSAALGAPPVSSSAAMEHDGSASSKSPPEVASAMTHSSDTLPLLPLPDFLGFDLALPETQVNAVPMRDADTTETSNNAPNSSGNNDIKVDNVSVSVPGHGAQTTLTSVEECTQSVDGDILVTTSTAVSVQKQRLSALFAGATISHCNFHININK